MNLNTLTALNAASVALALSDGTPVEFAKITSKDNIQVRVPTSHPLGAADPLRIFDRNGNSTKGSTSLTLSATAADASAPAPVASNDNVTYSVGGNDFDNLEDAKSEAIDLFAETGNTVDIVVTKVVGRVGYVALAA